MLARVLLFAAILVAPLYSQDDDVMKYLQEMRAPRPPRDSQAMDRALLALNRQQLDQTTDPAQKAALYVQISHIEQSLGQPDAAIAAARNARDLDPESEKAALGLAQILVENKQTAEVPALLGVDPANAAALIQKASSLNSTALAAFCAELAHELVPDDPKVADALGSIYLREGASTQAASVFRQAVDRAPQVAGYHYHLARALLLESGRDEARSEFVLALQSNPSDAERANLERVLAGMDAPHKQE